MKHLKIVIIALVPVLLITTVVMGQEAGDELQSVFVDLTKHEGWGPFEPREGFESNYYTGNFTLAGQQYKVFQLKHASDPYEERFMFRKLNSEVTFSEKEGGTVYYRYGVVELEDTRFDIVGYSERADQFVLTEKEDVNYGQTGLKQGTTAPLFEANSLSGQAIALDDYQDQYVLLDFWGTWCGPCLKETPYLKEAYKNLGDRVQFIGIAADDKTRLTKYIEEKNIEWPQIFIPLDKRWSSQLVKKYNVYGYPAYFLINPEGKIVTGPEQEHRLRGEALMETLEKVLSQ